MPGETYSVTSLSEANVVGVPYPGDKGVVAAGTTTTVTLAASATNVASALVGCYIKVGIEYRVITEYTTGRVATLDTALSGAPTGGVTIYEVYGRGGVAVSATRDTITIPVGFSSNSSDQTYSILRITSGTGAGQVRTVIGHDVTNNILTVDKVWDQIPDSLSTFALYGEYVNTTVITTSTVITCTNLLDETLNFYAGCYLVPVLTDVLGTSIRSDPRKITAQSGKVLTLEKPYPASAVGQALTFRIVGGWAPSFANLERADSVQVAVVPSILPNNSSGVLMHEFSPVPTGSMSGPAIVLHHSLAEFGRKIGIRETGGSEFSERSAHCQYYRGILHLYTGFVGSLSVRKSITQISGSAAASGTTGASTSSGVSPGYITQVAQGIVPGSEAVKLYGQIPAVTTASATAGTVVGSEVSGSNYPIILAPGESTFKVQSTDAADTDGGDGAQTLLMSGVSSGGDEISETISMNGGTQVSTTRTDWAFVNSITITKVGVDATNAGHIRVSNTAVTEVYAYIPPGQGKFNRLAYSVPRSKSGYLYWSSFSLHVSTGGGAQEADITIYTSERGIKSILYTVKLDSVMHPSDETNQIIPHRIPPSSVIWAEITAQPGAGSPTIRGRMDLILAE